MGDTFNVYCDESCHLERGRSPVMMLGCIWCPTAMSRSISDRIRGVKAYHGLTTQDDYTPPNKPFEIKWTKVSPAKADFYNDLVNLFFEEPNLRFRGVLIPDKSKLRHSVFDQTHDDWYYKMMFLLIDRIVNPEDRYRIYLDIKDTRSEEKRSKLETILRHRARDQNGNVIERVQQIRSHESELMQLADLLMGAITYINRRNIGDLHSQTANKGKLEVVNRIQKLSGKSLTETTWQGERKLNLLRWEAQNGGSLPC